MNEEVKNLTPAYTSYKSFNNLINDLRENGIPNHITRSVVKGSNSGKAMMLASLRSLGLIKEDLAPAPILKRLVKGEDNYADVLNVVLKESYPFLFDGSIDLANTTTEKVAEKFRDAGASGSTISKGMAFFLAAAKEAGISVSSRVKSMAPPRASTPKKRHNDKIPSTDDRSKQLTGPDTAPLGFISIPIPLHGMEDGAIWLPDGLNKKQWDYAKKMAEFILDNYRQDFNEENKP